MAATPCSPTTCKVMAPRTRAAIRQNLYFPPPVSFLHYLFVWKERYPGTMEVGEQVGCVSVVPVQSVVFFLLFCGVDACLTLALKRVTEQPSGLLGRVTANKHVLTNAARSGRMQTLIAKRFGDPRENWGKPNQAC